MVDIPPSIRRVSFFGDAPAEGAKSSIKPGHAAAHAASLKQLQEGEANRRFVSHADWPSDKPPFVSYDDSFDAFKAGYAAEARYARTLATFPVALEDSLGTTKARFADTGVELTKLQEMEMMAMLVEMNGHVGKAVNRLKHSFGVPELRPSVVLAPGGAHPHTQGASQQNGGSGGGGPGSGGGAPGSHPGGKPRFNHLSVEQLKVQLRKSGYEARLGGATRAELEAMLSEGSV